MLPAHLAPYSAGMHAHDNSTRHTQATRVFLVEDSAIVRERLIRLLAGIEGVDVVGDADNPNDAIAGIVAATPDVVVLDVKLRNGSGIDVLKHIKARLPRVTVVMLTNYATSEYRHRCLTAGAQYFLDKTNEFQNLQSILVQLKHNPHAGVTPSC